MDGLLQFAEYFGIEPGPPRWDIPVSDADRARAADALGDDRPAVVISPCTGARFRNFRNWRPERYAAVADYAAEHFGARVVLSGGGTDIERQYGEAIERLTHHRPLNLIGQTSLKTLLCVLERAAVVVCPDSGPAHMATAVGTPVVGLYATSNRHRTGPYFSQHLVADRYPDAVRAQFGVSVERLRFGQRVRNPDAMDLISVADVCEKLDNALAGSHISALPDTADGGPRDD